MIQYDYNKVENLEMVTDVVPIAGSYETSHGRNLDAQLTRLKGSASNSDAEREGVRVELNGGMKPFDKKNGVKQKAIIEFDCDASLTGLEGVEEGGVSKGEDTRRRRAEGEEDGEEEGDGDGEEESDGEADDSSLQFISYKEEGDNTEVLRLTWKTKHACERDVDSGSGSKSSHWGFFTWMIIM